MATRSARASIGMLTLLDAVTKDGKLRDYPHVQTAW